MTTLFLRDLNKKFGDNLVVNNVNLDVQDQDFIVLLGPSGCGKTTILRMIAGLEKVTSGEIILDGEVINRVPPQRRDMAMVFQNYALYAHLKIFDNLAFGLRMRKTPKDEIEKRVKDVAEMLHIDLLLDRIPRQLSGGERQRVALGRAIVREPRLFLMDEPLSNLDALLRVQTRVEILQLCRRIGATVLYVTHDQTEAMTMGQRIVLLRKGVVQQIDTAEGLYNKPANRFVGHFVGSPPMNFLEDVILSHENDRWSVKSQDFSLDLSGYENAAKIKQAPELVSRSVVVGFRPDAVKFISSDEPEEGIPASVEVVEVLGREALVYCDIGQQLICAVVPPQQTPRTGEKIVIGVDASKLHLFDSESGKNIAVLTDTSP
ncbi:MAG TPA: ABC transporter ATP-binding protein [Anaerolineae bacterium]|nr:ABC transporter ATP-binding protein [Anaerolineae bacterium]